MPKLEIDLSQSLIDALQAERRLTGETVEHIVSRSLADSLQVDHATLFQVSTAGALVEGVSGEIISIATLREHGDFGLGTFAGFDGEMAVLDGRFFQIRGDGTIREATDAIKVPFAVVTHFVPQVEFALEACSSLRDLETQLDRHRTSDNRFYAIRIDGTFRSIKTRAVCKQPVGQSLSDAADAQAMFDFADVKGTMMGFWAPLYARTMNVTGWHIHFLSDDRTKGGHLLDCVADGGAAGFEALSDFRVAIPETAAFLEADLGGDPTAVLDKAERDPA